MLPHCSQIRDGVTAFSFLLLSALYQQNGLVIGLSFFSLSLPGCRLGQRGEQHIAICFFFLAAFLDCILYKLVRNKSTERGREKEKGSIVHVCVTVCAVVGYKSYYMHARRT